MQITQVRWARRAMIATVGVLMAAACSGGSSDESTADTTEAPTATSAAPTTATPTAEAPPTEASPTTTEAPPTTSEPSRVDSAELGSCADFAIFEFLDVAVRAEFECTTVTVPIDHSGDVPGTIDIGVTVLRSSGDAAAGALFVNPGGPGGAASDMLLNFALGVIPPVMWETFDIVAMDPRAVGDSEPEFGCGPTDDIDDLLATIEGNPDTPDEVAAGEAAARRCVEEMGVVAGYLGTRDVAHDMDLVREALGVETISYLGYSYGSTIGVMYASLYPDRVRAMVVDGADNPLDVIETAEDVREELLEEIQPFEDQLGLALGSCEPSCPFGDDPAAALRSAAANAAAIEALFDDNPGAFSAAIIGTLYDESAWPDLHQGLVDLAAGDPSTLEPYAAINIEPDETSPSITEHVNCLDDWTINGGDRDEQLALFDEAFPDGFDEFAERFPLLQAIDEGDPDSGLTDVEASSVTVCAFYDVIVGPELAVPFDGGGVPIVVIGNRSDPFTSFGESQELVDEVLSAGVLVEVDHPQHTVYPQNPCVTDIVHAALIDVVQPAAGTFCEESSEGEVGEFGVLCLIVLDIVVEEVGLDDPEDPADTCRQAEVIVRADLGDEETDRLLADLESDEAGETLGVALGLALIEVIESGT